MNGLGELALATLAFVGGHFLLSSPWLRPRVVSITGEKGFSGLYSVVSGVLFVWMLLAYRSAPFVPLWQLPPVWKMLPVLVMPFAVFFLLASLTQKNPTLGPQPFLPGTADPAPGVLKVTRHPMLWAFGLWALSHLVVNGNGAAVILCGGIAVLALGGMLALDYKRRLRDPDGFARFAAATSYIPFLAMIQGRQKLRLADLGLWRLIAAAILYVVLLYAHPYFTGRAIV
jgi:uncharacterized membrane protein